MGHQDVMIQRLEVETDEMASFVHKKANKQGIWIALNAKTRQVIAFHVGDRSRKSAKRLWAKIPRVYRLHAISWVKASAEPMPTRTTNRSWMPV
jgi:IS1 transposase